MPFKIPSAARKAIIEKLLTTTERKALWEQAGPAVEDIVSESAVKRAYIAGSMASKKSNPSDIDLILRMDPDVGWRPVIDRALKEEEMHTPLDVIPTEYMKNPASKSYLSLKGTHKDVVHMRNKGRERYGKDYKWIRIAGLTGALGSGGSLAAEEEAEAFPIGKVIRMGTKASTGVMKSVKSGGASRTADLLKGTEFRGGTIKTVTKGRGDGRYIVLEDDTSYPVTKDVVSDMVRQRGTASKMTELATKEGAGQVEQAIKSLMYHEARVSPFETRATLRDYYKRYRRNVKDSGIGDTEPYCIVQRKDKKFAMPEQYATILEKEGHLKILERIK